MHARAPARHAQSLPEQCRSRSHPCVRQSLMVCFRCMHPRAMHTFDVLEEAALRVQLFARHILARRRARLMARQRFGSAIDADTGRRYYFERVTQAARWTPPHCFHPPPYVARREACRLLQRWWRGVRTRLYVCQPLVHSAIEVHECEAGEEAGEGDAPRVFYFSTLTGRSMWTPPWVWRACCGAVELGVAEEELDTAP